jgi:hypothetical protein
MKHIFFSDLTPHNAGLNCAMDSRSIGGIALYRCHDPVVYRTIDVTYFARVRRFHDGLAILSHVTSRSNYEAYSHSLPLERSNTPSCATTLSAYVQPPLALALSLFFSRSRRNSYRHPLTTPSLPLPCSRPLSASMTSVSRRC